MRRICAFALLFWILPAHAQQDPLQLVQQTAERMLAEIRAHKAELQQHPERIYDLVEDIVLPHFDFERMSRLVLGRYWRSATPEQRRRFVKEFRMLLVRTYANALLEYSDQKLSYGPVRGSGDEVTVHTEVAQPGGLPIPIDY
ncbi:MAG: ABC transporter substrate-binding protein, partial [Gammaproteobacteria bacterium]